MKFDSKKMDLENLDELIAKCEESMIQPFRKKKKVEEAPLESEEEEEEVKSDLSPEDMEELIRMYMEAKED